MSVLPCEYILSVIGAIIMMHENIRVMEQPCSNKIPLSGGGGGGVHVVLQVVSCLSTRIRCKSSNVERMPALHLWESAVCVQCGGLPPSSFHQR